MGYVALSRVRRLSGLKLMNLNEIALTVHPKILQQDKIFKDSSSTTVKYLQTLSKTEKEQYHIKTLVERFLGDNIKAIDKEKNKRSKKTANPTYITTSLSTRQIVETMNATGMPENAMASKTGGGIE